MQKSLLALYRNRVGCTIDSLAKEVEILVKEFCGEVKVIWRIKDVDTLRKKMKFNQTQDVFLIEDVYGIRILVNTESNAYLALERIKQKYAGFLKHDYLKNPKTRPDKPHLAGKMLCLLQFVASKNRALFEIQITTHKFNEANELLHLEYHREKYSSP